MYKLDKTSNCVFSLHYHLIVVVKYRRKVFTKSKLITDLKDYIYKVSKDYDVDVIEIGIDTDHLHLLFKSKPTLDIPKYINILKGHSSRYLRKNHKSFLSDKLWGDAFWSPSYFLSTTGNVTIEILKKYVESQGE